MARCEEEFNPWPSFVDIFSSVILVLLLFLLVVLVNLGYYAQFKYKVSYTGSISNDDIISNYDNNKSTKENILITTKVTNSSASSSSNADVNIRIIDEQKQMILALQNQISTDDSPKSSKAISEVDSPGIDIADKTLNEAENQKIIQSDDYLIITYKGNEVFIDDTISRKVKQFLSSAKDKYKNHKIYIYSYDIKEQLSATISKQISLARTMSTRNLIRKFGYEKKDVLIDLGGKLEIKEKIDAKNGYLVIKIVK
jgi:hypothetical protein